MDRKKFNELGDLLEKFNLDMDFELEDDTLRIFVNYDNGKTNEGVITVYEVPRPASLAEMVAAVAKWSELHPNEHATNPTPYEDQFWKVANSSMLPGKKPEFFSPYSSADGPEGYIDYRMDSDTLIPGYYVNFQLTVDREDTSKSYMLFVLQNKYYDDVSEYFSTDFAHPDTALAAALGQFRSNIG